MEKENSSGLLIKTFLYEGNYYLYDTFLNVLFKIKKEHYQIIKKVERDGFDEYSDYSTLSDCEKDILMLRRRGAFSSGLIKNVRNPFLDYAESFLENSVNDMVLQVTKNCNFNCRYCLYAGDEGIERGHEETCMTQEMARKCIDFLYKHSSDSPKINISFYGGEPLLNFNLIKDAVEYAKTKFYSKPVDFSMTINGSLLNKNNVDFLVDNQFALSISLDGPKTVQNRHRKFKDTGKGTFSTVMSNVMYIKNEYPDFFERYVSFIPVVIDDEDYRNVSDFFSEVGVSDSKVKPIKANLNGVDYYLSSSNGVMNSSLTNVDKASDGINDDAARSLLGMYQRKEKISPVWHHGGQCIPGAQRIFVDCNGNFFPCEKIVENDALKIGNLRDGFDIRKIKDMMSIGQLTEDRCKKCWACRFCEICVSLCLDVDSNTISRKIKERACKAQQDNAMWIFKKMIKARSRQ